MDNTNTIIVFLACIMAIIIFGKILILPLKKILRLLINSILGGTLIVLINWIGATFNLHIGLNVATAIFVRNIRSTRSNTFNYIQINTMVIEKRVSYYKNAYIKREKNIIGHPHNY